MGHGRRALFSLQLIYYPERFVARRSTLKVEPSTVIEHPQEGPRSYQVVSIAANPLEGQQPLIDEKCKKIEFAREDPSFQDELQRFGGNDALEQRHNVRD